MPISHRQNVILPYSEREREDAGREVLQYYPELLLYYISNRHGLLIHRMCCIDTSYCGSLKCSAAIAVRHLNSDPEIAKPTQYPYTIPVHFLRRRPTSLPCCRPAGVHFTHQPAAPTQVLDIQRKNSHSTKHFPWHMCFT